MRQLVKNFRKMEAQLRYPEVRRNASIDFVGLQKDMKTVIYTQKS